MDLERERLEQLRPGMTDLRTGDVAPSPLWSALGVALSDSSVTAAMARTSGTNSSTVWEVKVVTPHLFIEAVGRAPWAGWASGRGQARTDDNYSVTVSARPLADLRAYRIEDLQELPTGREYSVSATFVFEFEGGRELVLDGHAKHPQVREQTELLAFALIASLRDRSM